ncbi:DUF2239 family protein [Thermomonas brevis]
MIPTRLRCTAFAGHHRIASGELLHVAIKAKQAHDANPARPVLVFDDASGQQLSLPLELPAAELLRQLSQPELPEAPPAPPKRKPGRPRLGVVAREVTLLPRHWDWLAAQPGGASVALRRLVDAARKVGAGDDARRAAQETAYRFMQALAGDLPGYEEAIRALFAGDFGRFEGHIAHWPDDVRDHAALLAADAFH